MEVLVSVITVSYNSELTIAETIESVLNQSYKNIEYFIIDGMSNDRTVEIAKSYSHKFQQNGIPYTIISEKDDGIYDAMNKGIHMSNGDLIGIINSDDWYELFTIERVVQTYIDSHFDYFYGDIRIINGKKSSIKHSKIRKNYVTSRDWNHPTSFVSKKVYEKFIYKNETIYDDFDLLLKVRNNGFKIVVVNEVLANFRVGGISNIKNIKNVIQRIKQRYSIYKNNQYSKLYLLECITIEVMKYILA